MLTCTWAPTVFHGHQIVSKTNVPPTVLPSSEDLLPTMTRIVQRYEQLGITHLLIAQRWWGDGTQMEASSLDCLATTALFAGVTNDIKLVTAIHPGFFQPTAIAKWGASLDRITGGRWAINVTSGWHMDEFDMYGIDTLSHDERYERSAEFIKVLRGAWEQRGFDFQGDYYRTAQLHLEPQPEHPLEIFQGGQSDAAINLAAKHSNWMFLNGGSLERIEEIVHKVRKACAKTGRQVRFAMYAAPLCRPSTDAAWAEIDAQLAAVDTELAQRRRTKLAQGAQGMWSDETDPLSMLDTNEGYAARLIGSPDDILERIAQYRAIGIDMLHLDLRDELFVNKVLPTLADLD